MGIKNSRFRLMLRSLSAVLLLLFGTEAHLHYKIYTDETVTKGLFYVLTGLTLYS